ncbi:MAG: hypothetical protein RRZ73_01875 [Oscillospiraceae bacterium]
MPNQSEAYDFSRFEDTNETVEPKLKVTEGVQKQAQGVITVKAVVLVLMLIAVVTMMIYNKVVITELSAEISSSQKQLSALEDQEEILSAQVENSVSLNSIEQTVTKDLGLSKADAYQIEYIKLVKGDNIQLKNQTDDGIISKVAALGKRLLEYMGIG